MTGAQTLTAERYRGYGACQPLDPPPEENREVV